MGPFEIVKTRNLTQIQALSNRGKIKFDIRDSEGETPLHTAASEGSSEIIKFLITDKGLDPNAKNHNGETPMHKAASKKHLDALVTLAANGANTEIRDLQGVKWRTYINDQKFIDKIMAARLEYLKQSARSQHSSLPTAEDKHTLHTLRRSSVAPSHTLPSKRKEAQVKQLSMSERPMRAKSVAAPMKMGFDFTSAVENIIQQAEEEEELSKSALTKRAITLEELDDITRDFMQPTEPENIKNSLLTTTSPEYIKVEDDFLMELEGLCNEPINQSKSSSKKKRKTENRRKTSRKDGHKRDKTKRNTMEIQKSDLEMSGSSPPEPLSSSPSSLHQSIRPKLLTRVQPRPVLRQRLSLVTPRETDNENEQESTPSVPSNLNFKSYSEIILPKYDDDNSKSITESEDELSENYDSSKSGSRPNSRPGSKPSSRPTSLTQSRTLSDVAENLQIDVGTLFTPRSRTPASDLSKNSPSTPPKMTQIFPKPIQTENKDQNKKEFKIIPGEAENYANTQRVSTRIQLDHHTLDMCKLVETINSLPGAMPINSTETTIILSETKNFIRSLVNLLNDSNSALENIEPQLIEKIHQVLIQIKSNQIPELAQAIRLLAQNVEEYKSFQGAIIKICLSLWQLYSLAESTTPFNVLTLLKNSFLQTRNITIDGVNNVETMPEILLNSTNNYLEFSGAMMNYIFCSASSDEQEDLYNNLFIIGMANRAILLAGEQFCDDQSSDLRDKMSTVLPRIASQLKSITSLFKKERIPEKTAATNAQLLATSLRQLNDSQTKYAARLQSEPKGDPSEYTILELLNIIFSSMRDLSQAYFKEPHDELSSIKLSLHITNTLQHIISLIYNLCPTHTLSQSPEEHLNKYQKHLKIVSSCLSTLQYSKSQMLMITMMIGIDQSFSKQQANLLGLCIRNWTYVFIFLLPSMYFVIHKCK